MYFLGRPKDAISIAEEFEDESPLAARVIFHAALKAGDALVATHLPNAVSGLKVEVVK